MVLKMPVPAEKPIAAVLDEFLEAQRSRLKPRTYGRYEHVIRLFETSMNWYAHQGLSAAERALFDDLYDRQGQDHREFCQIFGPEKVPQNVAEFLNYFLPRKVLCGKGLLRAAGTVTRKLTAWLKAKGCVSA